MPTVLRIGGLRIVIYPNDHRPAHVHAIGEAVFDLHCPDGPVEFRENFGFTRADTGRIAVHLSRRVIVLCQEWKRIHGTFR